MKPDNPFSKIDVRDISALRDEARLQAHLFKAELADRWQEAERRWSEIEDEVRASATHSRAELSAAASLTAETLRDSYRDLLQALRPR